jgi:hypothetical protein
MPPIFTFALALVYTMRRVATSDWAPPGSRQNS